MFILLAIVAIALLLMAFFAIVGLRSRAIFTNPTMLSDAQIDAIIELTRRIMNKMPAGSPTWARAAAKYKAAIDEQMRRQGKAPFDDIELTGPAARGK
jgi:hypothetical protein